MIRRFFNIEPSPTTGRSPLTQLASAADLPRKAPAAPPPTPVYSWTGFYVGGNVGGGWADRDVAYFSNDIGADAFLLNTAINNGGNLAPPSSFDSSGVVGGLQVGYNWQFNRNWLAGLEADFDWSGVKGSTTSIATGGAFINAASFEERLKWFGTVRARLGFLPIDNLLLFGTGGFAYGRLERTASFSYPGSGYGLGIGGPPNANCNAPTTCFAGSSSDVATGWTVGGGVEYAVWQRWTVKAEYLYVSLKGDSVTEVALGVTQPASLTATFGRANFNIARVGANYRF